MKDLYTIGHAAHAIAHLLALLSMQPVFAIGDVRSSPYDRHDPQFTRGPLRSAMRRAGSDHAFLSRGLGARPGDAACCVDGKVQLEGLAWPKPFQNG